MKIISGIAAAVLILFSGLAAASGNVTGNIGWRTLDEELWGPVEQQPMFGVLVDFALGASPVHLAAGLRVSAAEEDDGNFTFTGVVSDLSVGIKLMPQHGVFRPYVGAGLALVDAAFEAETFGPDVDDDDQSAGFYAGGGAIFRVAPHVDVGFDFRWIGATDIELFDTEGDADNFSAGILIGYGWGDEPERRFRRRR
jgi:opacity protein-like surface antigen